MRYSLIRHTLLGMLALVGCGGQQAPASAAVDTSSAAPLWPPNFEQYATTDTLTGPAAPIDYAFDPDAGRFRSTLEAARQGPPDFAGHLRFVVWGCGTGCTSHLILDLRSGRTYDDTLVNFSCGTIDYRRNSSLLISRPDTAHGSLERCRLRPDRYFVWNDANLQELQGPPGSALTPIVVDTTLRIPLRSGDTTDFVSRPSDGERFIKFSYLRHLGGMPFHLVEVQYYETNGVLLIHDSTGRETRLRSEPVFSPDGREMVTFHHAWTAESGPSEITISRPDGDSLLVEFRWEQEVEYGWGPKEASWSTPDTIQIIREVPINTHQEFRDVPAYVSRDNGKWVLHVTAVADDTLYAR